MATMVCPHPARQWARTVLQLLAHLSLVLLAQLAPPKPPLTVKFAKPLAREPLPTDLLKSCVNSFRQLPTGGSYTFCVKLHLDTHLNHCCSAACQIMSSCAEQLSTTALLLSHIAGLPGLPAQFMRKDNFTPLRVTTGASQPTARFVPDKECLAIELGCQGGKVETWVDLTCTGQH